ncbi:SURF1 family protein [Microbacterium terricola]|uniref:SURF1-like protein n=1 Tax=Microbacterium terricola TaxID=344163 RepID=A0ABM8DXT9_9MICO|nr:SURF1 family protein [Microbacterium terricola]UYK38822.1 SURF1 family protein [Microbacterium terricola]BDV30483.1 hypothetical protein Microterr_11430 [Microbacterium terricola]
MSRQSAPAAVRWTAYVAVAIVFAIACAFLSNWQFTRNATRAEQLALVEANYDAAPVPLAEVIPAGGSLEPTDQWQPVTLTGTYLSEQQLLVRNRAHGGTAAFEVLVPLRLTDGRVIVIDRGWLPPGNEQPEPDEIPAAPAGEVTVIARLMPGEALPASGRSAPEGQVPTINLALIADTLPAADAALLEESAYGLMASEDPAPATRPNPVEDPSVDPGPHLSYAIQWILFAIMGFIFIGYVIRTERRHRREDAEERTRTTVRRKDRDADEEDALLDAAGR